jgi:hypothetical protein
MKLFTPRDRVVFGFVGTFHQAPRLMPTALAVTTAQAQVTEEPGE